MKMRLIICVAFIAVFSTIHSEESGASVTAPQPEGMEDVMKLLEGEQFDKNFETVDPDMSAEKEELEKAVQVAMQEMGIAQVETMDRENFRKLFTRVVLQDDQLPESEMRLFDKLIEKVINNAPEVFPTAEINKYIDLNFITSQLNEIMIEEGYDPNQAGMEPEDAKVDL